MNRLPTSAVNDALAVGVLLSAIVLLPHSVFGFDLPTVDTFDTPTVVLAFGSNRDGRTGLGLDSGNTLIATPIDSTNFSSSRAVQVDAASIGSHSLLLTDDGVAFAFGENQFGQTGLGISEGDTLVPTAVDTSNLAGRTVTEVESGWDYSLILANDGTVFSFGLNVNGRTGLGIDDNVTLIATPIDITNLTNKTVTQIEAGAIHNLLLTDDNTVFSFGWNTVGQTGLGTSGTDVLIATPIDTTNLGDRTIKQISAGADHNLLLADDGTVFAFGSNNSGETGLGVDTGATLVATPIDTTNFISKKIKQVSAGGLHSLLLAEDGTVFSFGSNTLGSTGLGTTNGDALIATPIDTTNIAGKTISQVSAGGVHSLLLADDGTVFSFGHNSSGQTGLGTQFSSTTVATPIDTRFLDGHKVVDISAGDNYSLVLAVEIPEPTSFVLLILGAGPLLILQRESKRSTSLPPHNFLSEQ